MVIHSKPVEEVVSAPHVEKPTPCEHGKSPWWDCEECRSTSHYGFSGNFK